jgi:hypothetical protein
MLLLSKIEQKNQKKLQILRTNYWRLAMTQWTAERRLLQSQAIRRWKPWEKSSGAKTIAGKEISKLNARKHGAYDAANRLTQRELTAYNRELKKLRQIIF